MAILFFGGRNLPSCWKYLHTCNPVILFVKSLCIFKIYFSKKRVTLLCIVSHNFSVIRHDLYATQISPGESTAQLWRPNIDLQVMDNTFHCNGFTSTNIGNVNQYWSNLHFDNNMCASHVKCTQSNCMLSGIEVCACITYVLTNPNFRDVYTFNSPIGNTNSMTFMCNCVLTKLGI